jgi:hypothetical protein
MAWEERSGRRYYYRKRRDGDRVVSEYVGTGVVADIAENMVNTGEMYQMLERLHFKQLVAVEEEIDRQLEEYDKAVAVMVRAYLLASGYHQHKRQWRLLRRG